MFAAARAMLLWARRAVTPLLWVRYMISVYLIYNKPDRVKRRLSRQHLPADNAALHLDKSTRAG